MPLIWATPSIASQMTLSDAQAALALAHQEVLDATEAAESATELISTSTVARDTAQIAYSEALSAWESTKVTVSGTTTTTTQNVVQNGSFDNASGWSNVINSTTVYTGGASPIAINGKLKGSYTAGIYIQQAGTFPSPTRQVTFGVDVWNYDTNEGNRIGNPDYYRIEFRTYNAAGQRLNYYNLEWSQWHDQWITRGGTYNLSDDAVRWDIGFRMQDSGYWAGAFGPEMDNVRLIATMNTTTPTTYTYGESETVAKNAAHQVLQDAQQALVSATAAQVTAQQRLSVAQTEVVRLTALVAELTPHLNAPTGLIAVINGDHVDLTWNAPTSNLSGVQVERYAIMWSTTNFIENGWGWSHDETSVSIPLSILSQYGGLGNQFQFSVRADNDTLAIYSLRSSVASIQTVVPPWWQIEFVEGQTVSIGTPNGFKFGSPTAWYGSPTDPNCGADVSAIVNEIINGRSTASFVADNGLFGDPCGGVVKVLRMSTPVDAIPAGPTAEEIAAEQARLEAIRIAAEQAAAAEAARLEAERLEAMRIEAERIAELERIERERLAAEEAARQELARLEAERIAAEKAAEEARLEAERLEAERLAAEKAAAEQARLEAEEKARVEAERLEQERLAALERERAEAEANKPKPTPTASPKPEPEPTEKPTVEIKEEITAENITAVVEELATITPQDLTQEQQTLIVEAALETFASAEQGSAEYEAALDALLVVAQADDIVLNEELAAIPLVGNVAGAAVEVFNALGNAGADMSPQVREQSEKVVIAAVIVGQVAMTATAAATSAAAAAARRP